MCIYSFHSKTTYLSKSWINIKIFLKWYCFSAVNSLFICNIWFNLFNWWATTATPDWRLLTIIRFIDSIPTLPRQPTALSNTRFAVFAQNPFSVSGSINGKIIFTQRMRSLKTINPISGYVTQANTDTKINSNNLSAFFKNSMDCLFIISNNSVSWLLVKT